MATATFRIWRGAAGQGAGHRRQRRLGTDVDQRPLRVAHRTPVHEPAHAVDDPVELRLVTATWNPHQVLGTPDDRNVGVMVDRVAVR